jgi:hypothetical protein
MTDRSLLRFAKLGALLLGAWLPAMAVLSYLTTSVMWDGGFPPGEFRLTVLNEQNQPVPGAELRVYHGGTRDPAYGYPLVEFTTARPLMGDESGQIVCHQLRDGLQFGGHAWKLLWLIPMGARSPQFDCEISAAGYRPRTFEVWELFRLAYQRASPPSMTTVPVHGQPVSLPVFTLSQRLERAGR